MAAEKKKGQSAKISGVSGSGRKGRSSGSGSAENHVANALRSAYEEAVKEDVPPEFLDLLGKLS